MSCEVTKVTFTNIPQQKGPNLSLCTTQVKDYLHYSNVLTVQFEVTGFAVSAIVFTLNYRLTWMQTYASGQRILKLCDTMPP
jgi:hypothetical protein